MANENELLEENSVDFDGIDLEGLEATLNNDLASELSDLEYLKIEEAKIGNPDALGKVVLDEVWKQFGNQIGLDMTNETLNQKYDREHPETYDEVGKKVMQDKRYKDKNKEMGQKQQDGNLKDEYTGKKLGPNDKANLDHTVSRKEIYENKRRRQANIATEDLANKDENLNATNEALNKSKGAKSVDKMIKTREKREKDLKAQNERAHKKIDESNMSEAEKKAAKKKIDKALQDKLDADDKLMKDKDKAARKAINKDIAKGVVKETGKKAGKDALKAMAVQALFDLLKELMNGFIRFIKSAAKTFKGLLEEMKKALHNFFSKILSFVKTGASTAVGTVVSEIFGPIVSTFKKLSSLIKQGVRSFVDAISYLRDKVNKSKPFSIKAAEVGKIVVAGLVAAGALFGGDIFEKGLISVFPALGTISLPLLGSLANIIGIFLASVISGVIGAIIINLIDRFIAEKQKQAIHETSVSKGNEILSTQEQLLKVKEMQLNKTKEKVSNSIKERHSQAQNLMKDSLDHIVSAEEINHDNDFDDMNNKLDNL
ncbi:hypothetical protein [Treponema sp.]|uniref:hypothetical protein n=1 Tax=Treponema sp. TaxID=166 RepID=UPI003FD7970E